MTVDNLPENFEQLMLCWLNTLIQKCCSYNIQHYICKSRCRLPWLSTHNIVWFVLLLDRSKSTWCACWRVYCCWWCSQGKGWGGL